MYLCRGKKNIKDFPMNSTVLFNIKQVAHNQEKGKTQRIR